MAETHCLDTVTSLLDYWRDAESDEEAERYEVPLKFSILGKEIVIHQKPHKSLRSVGLAVWNSSLVLSLYLESLFNRDPYFLKEKRVVEVGSGCGLCGIVASLMGAEVTLTDTPRVMGQLIKNTEANLDPKLHKFKVRELTWGKTSLNSFRPPVDVVLAADVIYQKKTTKALLRTLHRLTNEESLILLFFQEHDNDAVAALWENVGKFFEVSKISLQAEMDYQTGDTAIHTLRLKKIAIVEEAELKSEGRLEEYNS